MLRETEGFRFSSFDMKNLSGAFYVFDIEINRDRSIGVLGLCKNSYIEKVLKRYNMQNSTMTTIIVKGNKFGSFQSSRNQLEINQMRVIHYASEVT
jgi:hypothetical protein